MMIKSNIMTKNDMQALWYIVNVYGGHEQRIVETVKEVAEKKNIAHLFEDFLVPNEEVIEIRKNNKKVTRQQNYLPGYFLVKMVLTDDTWHLLRNVPRVTGLLGSKKEPTPISDIEVQRIINQVKESAQKPRTVLFFEIGEQVRISDGPFTSFQGEVEAIDFEKSRLRVCVSIFGRPTPVELEFNQVEKVK